MIADSAIPYNTNSPTQCANENSDDDYLNYISLEYQNIERKEPPFNEKLTKIFQDWIWNNTKPEKIEDFSKSVLPPENTEGLEPNEVNLRSGEQSHIRLTRLLSNCRICRLLCKSPLQ